MASPELPMALFFQGVSRTNAAFHELLGYGTEQITADNWLDSIHPEDRAALMESLRSGGAAKVARLRSQGGDWLPFEWTMRTQDDRQAVLGRGVGATRQPAASNRSSPLREPMAATLEAMARIVEAKNPGLLCSILLVDDEGTHAKVGAGPSLPAEYNAAIEGLRIGPTVGSCGTAAYWNVPVIVQDIATDPLWQDLRDAAALARMSACWSHPINATNGEVVGAMALYCTEAREPTRNELDGLEIAARMVGLAVERDRLEDKLSQTAKMEALGVLAGGIAHDFNNMLTTIQGNAELAIDALPADATAQHMLREIVTACAGATELCNQMLAYAGRGARSTELLDGNKMLQELGGLLQVAMSKKVQLEYRLCDAPLGINADPGQLRQVLMNLITNAAEAIGNQEGRILVATRTRSSQDLLRTAEPAPDTDDLVEMTVTDTGCGMSSATIARIFDPFFTTKATGRGLGLAAVQGIVRAHGGTIRVDSTPGEGTTCTITLPRSDLPVAAAALPRHAPPSLAGSRVLVVDDEPGVREVLSKMLDSVGALVIPVEDGAEAIRIYREHARSIDCVLLDLSMPKLDGEEVFAALKQVNPDVRVILISGYTEQEILDRFRGAGLAGALQKPPRMAALLERVGAALKDPQAARLRGSAPPD